MSELHELTAFWDAFALEYEENLNEQKSPLAEMVAQFLQSRGILPTDELLDLAGGSGRFMVTLQPAVKDYTLVDLSQKMLDLAQAKALGHSQFIRREQSEFLATSPKQYSVVFSAMNPTLTLATLVQMQRLAREWVILLHFKTSQDQLFSPLEEQLGEKQGLELTDYHQWLNKLGIDYFCQPFSYTKSEMVSRAFFKEYFSAEFSPADLEAITTRLFAASSTKENVTTLSFELLYWQPAQLPLKMDGQTS
ncbi:MAG: methyltransferase domain-containing protein [Enterococcus sp.]